ncbi:subtilisin-like serine protease PR1C [Moelleriella libera RCEF 2490]|uniref:Subtilisin-like serine protease PR1C n=1 Tax=Moelleriella libera RCEF 2490 TaxID=1081109 RepID=A0A168EGC3_9HYPO|nr:subtilisin-like serine protease PR1C [Moelleriella libera RCEF 2490]
MVSPPGEHLRPYKPSPRSLSRRWCNWWGTCVNTVVHGVYEPHRMTQVDQLHAKGITGSGLKVAVIDTGIDFKHPVLGTTIGSCLKSECGSCFGKGCLVEYGYDFVGNDFNGENTPIPDKDPMDCNGHGTHVAGIISARKNDLGFIGAAPGVKLGAYKVFGCSGDTPNDILVAASLQAFEDGSDIITASIGAANGWNEHPWGTVINRITAQGVPFICSAGNEGSSGLFYANGGAASKAVTAIGSMENRVIPKIMIKSTWRENKGLVGTDFHLLAGEPKIWGVDKMRLWATSLDYDYIEDCCKPLPEDYRDLSKYVVLVRASNCPFNIQVINIMQKGAKYMIIYNHRDETFTPTPTPIPEGLLAVGMVEYKLGKKWIRIMNEGKKVHVTIPHPYKAFQHSTTAKMEPNDKEGGLISLFTSWGPTWQMLMKPQFTAPGGNILSTWPMAKGGYSVQSGTSMATPLVASIMALMYQVRGRIGLPALTDLLSSTAKPQIFYNGTKRFGMLAPPAQQGGGLVQAFDAAYTTTRLYPSSLSFNDTVHLAPELNFTIMNYGKSSVIYTLGHRPALTMYTLANGTNMTMNFPNEIVDDAHATLSFHHGRLRVADPFHHMQPVKRVTIEAGNRAIITVRAKPPKVEKPERLAVWGGYITINGTDKSALSMPYQGLAGNLTNVTVLEPGNAAWVVSVKKSQFVVPPPDTPVPLPSGGSHEDQEVVLKVACFLNLGTANLSIDIVPQGGAPPADKVKDVFGLQTLGQMYGFPMLWVGRGYGYYKWDGKLASGDFAPAGRYIANVRALKLNGDPVKENNWETAKTNTIDLSYE